ncbi:phosphoglycerate kinase [Bacteroidota bacterium]|nr:phosphoglycerate kinase [Bacteroidota bacterium]
MLITELDLNDKKVLVRVDFNVPVDKNLGVTDNTRIKSSKKTISYILENGGTCILISHMGRPKGYDEKQSLKNIVNEVGKVLNKEITFINDCIGDNTKRACKESKKGDVLLLENLRFYSGEEDGDLEFAKSLSELGDIYINDAFGTAHRNHASTGILPSFFQGCKAMGFLLSREVDAIETFLNNGQKPILSIIGGAKVSSKIEILNNLINVVDDIIIAGGMAYTFIKSMGGEIGNSLCEDEFLKEAKDILFLANRKNVNLHFPEDVIVSREISKTSSTEVASIYNIPTHMEGLDIGPKTLNKFSKIILRSNTILWNGPVGVFEIPNFQNGTKQIASAIAKATECGAFSLVGGGDSISAIKLFRMDDKFSYISTGGGAMLESIEGKVLPGIKAILN